MESRIRARLQVAQRRRELADRSRAGRYPRSVVWERQWDYARRAWPFLGATLLIPTIAVAPVVILQQGAIRWTLVGASIASGLWLAVLTTVLNSGAAGMLMGLSAEEWTADQLRPLRRRGWQVVNGFRLRPKADIDHVAVGRPGVFVVETKWSEDAWPVGVAGDAFMMNRLASAIRQVRRNSDDVANHFSRELAGAPAHSVLVLWSGSSWLNASEWIERDSVTVISGRALGQWLGKLDAQDLDEERIRQVWTAIDKQAARRDSRELASSAQPKPTMEQMWSRWVLQPLAGIFVAGYVFVAINLLHHWLIAVTTSLAALLIGLRARRVPVLRWVSLGWISLFGIVLSVLPVLVTIDLLR